MKIREIRAFPLDVAPQHRTQPRVPKLPGSHEFVSPMNRYPEFTRGGAALGRNWKRTGCLVTAEDGTWASADGQARKCSGSL